MHKNCHFLFHPATLFALLLLPNQCLGQDREPVRIALLPEVVADSEIVTLSQLAELRGGDATKRSKMAKLDFAVDSNVGQSIINRDEAVARLLIAGFESKEFLFDGATEVRFRASGDPGANALANSPTSRRIRRAIVEHVSSAIGLLPEDVAVDLLTVPDNLLNKDITTMRVTPLDHGDQLIGRRTVVLGLFSNDFMVEKVSVVAQTSYYREVLVARNPIEKGEPLTQQNAFMRRTEFANRTTSGWLGAEQFGRKTSRRIRAQSLIRPGDLVDPRNEREAFLVRTGDLVSVTAARGSLKVTMSGMQAMKAGRAGDTIPLKNIQTRKIIYGRIIDSSRIEVSF